MSPSLVAERCGVGGGPQAAPSLKGLRKPRAGPHCRTNLAGRARAFPSAAAAVGAGLSRRGSLGPRGPGARPSRVFTALRSPAPSLARSLSSALSRSLSFFSCCRAAAAAPPGARISAGGDRGSAPAPLPSQRGALGRTPLPEPLPLSLALGRRAPRRTEPSLPPLPSSPARSRSSSRPPRARRQPGPGGRQLLPAASGTPGGSSPGSVRSVRAARRGPGSGHREPPASGRRLPAPPSARRRAVSCGPRVRAEGTAPSGLGGASCGGDSGVPRGGLWLAPALGAAQRRAGGPELSGLEDMGPGVEGLSSGLGPGVGRRVFCGSGGKCSCAWGCVGFPRLGGRARAQVGTVASVRPLCGEAGPAGARAVLCPGPRGSLGGRAAPAVRAPSRGLAPRPAPVAPQRRIGLRPAPAPAGARRRQDGTAPQGLGSPQGPGTSGSGASQTLGTDPLSDPDEPLLLRERPAGSRLSCVCVGGAGLGGVPSGVGPSVYVCVGGSPPGSGRVCVCVCWGVPSGVGLPSRPGAGGVPSLSGGGAGGGGPTARGAPAPGRSEAVCAEMGRQWRRRES